MVDIRKEYNRHFLSAELLLSIVITFFIIYFIISTWSHDNITNWISTNRKEIYPLIASISGTLLGFVITGVSIIIAFSESERLRLLKQSKQYKAIYNIYFNTIGYLAFTTVISIVGVIVNNGIADYILYISIWSVVISSFRIWRCIWVLQNIVEIIHEPI